MTHRQMLLAAARRLSPLSRPGRHKVQRQVEPETHLSIPIGERLSGWVAAVKQPMINADAALDLFDVAAGSLCCAVAACCPRTDGSRIVLTLYSSHTGVFSPFHVRLLSEVVALVDRSSSTAADLFEAGLPAS